MCTQNPHLKDLRQHPAQDRACCTHTAGYPRFPDLRPIGTPIPVSRPNRETGDFPISVPGRSGLGIGNSLPVSRPNRESVIPSPFPGQIGNRGNGNWGFPGLFAAPADPGGPFRPAHQTRSTASQWTFNSGWHGGGAQCQSPGPGLWGAGSMGPGQRS